MLRIVLASIICLPSIILLCPMAFLLGRKAVYEQKVVMKLYGINRVKGTDVMATMKCMWSLALYPLHNMILFSFMLWYLLYKYEMDFNTSIATTFICFVVYHPYNYRKYPFPFHTPFSKSPSLRRALHRPLWAKVLPYRLLLQRRSLKTAKKEKCLEKKSERPSKQAGP